MQALRSVFSLALYFHFITNAESAFRNLLWRLWLQVEDDQPPIFNQALPVSRLLLNCKIKINLANLFYLICLICYKWDQNKILFLSTYGLIRWTVIRPEEILCFVLIVSRTRSALMWLFVSLGCLVLCLLSLFICSYYWETFLTAQADILCP